MGYSMPKSSVMRVFTAILKMDYEYLAIVAHWLRHFGLSGKEIEAARSEALVWALERGSRSGRVAWQFAKHWAGSKS